MTVPSKIGDLGKYGNWIRAMIVADAGFGKTVFCGTAKNALFLTTDPEGTISAKVFGSTAKEWKIESWTEFNESYRYLRDGGIKELNLGVVIVDNISEAQNLGMTETMHIARDRNKGLDEFVPTQQDYQRSQNMLRQMVKQFHDLPVHIIWTAWQKVEEDREGNPYFAPGIHGQQGMLAQTIAGYMNIVGYGEVLKNSKDEEVRRLWFSQSGSFRGKDRFNVLGRYRDRLDVPKMLTLVERAIREMEKNPSTSTNVTPIKKKSALAPRRAVQPRKKA